MLAVQRVLSSSRSSQLPAGLIRSSGADINEQTHYQALSIHRKVVTGVYRQLGRDLLHERIHLNIVS